MLRMRNYGKRNLSFPTWPCIWKKVVATLVMISHILEMTSFFRRTTRWRKYLIVFIRLHMPLSGMSTLWRPILYHRSNQKHMDSTTWSNIDKWLFLAEIMLKNSSLFTKMANCIGIQVVFQILKLRDQMDALQYVHCQTGQRWEHLHGRM